MLRISFQGIIFYAPSLFKFLYNLDHGTQIDHKVGLTVMTFSEIGLNAL